MGLQIIWSENTARIHAICQLSNAPDLQCSMARTERALLGAVSRVVEALVPTVVLMLRYIKSQHAWRRAKPSAHELHFSNRHAGQNAGGEVG